MDPDEFKHLLDTTLRQKLIPALGPVTKIEIEKAIYKATNRFTKLP